MSRQSAFGVSSATEITPVEQAWVGEAAERIDRSNRHFVAYLSDGSCMCGGTGHRDVVYSPTLIAQAQQSLGVSFERASRLVAAAEDAAGGKLGF